MKFLGVIAATFATAESDPAWESGAGFVEVLDTAGPWGIGFLRADGTRAVPD